MSYALLSHQTDAGPRAGLLIGARIHDAAAATGESADSTLLGILDDWQRAEDRLRSAAGRIAAGNDASGSTDLASARLLAPVLHPGAIYAAGANFLDHVREMERAQGMPPGPTMKELGELPWHFIKGARSCVVGPGAAVRLPRYSQTVDWEVELVAVIGRTASDVSAADALGFVAGYTIADDLSARDAMLRHGNAPASPFRYDWVAHKCFDGACPTGPWMVPARDIPDPQNLGIKLWVDGEPMQDSNTSQMIFSVAEQVAALSSRVTLHPGDMILTGTPAGVGMPRNVFLKPGQTVRMWIERIGEFEHTLA